VLASRAAPALLSNGIHGRELLLPAGSPRGHASACARCGVERLSGLLPRQRYTGARAIGDTADATRRNRTGSCGDAAGHDFAVSCGGWGRRGRGTFLGPPIEARRACVFAIAATLGGMTSVCGAQAAPAPPGQILLQADEVTYDSQGRIVTAKGHVEIVD